MVLQDDVRLDAAMQDGSFYSNEIFLQTIEDVKQHHSSLHLICLLSEKSSHGSIDYPLALLRMAKDHQLTDVYIHVIFDGRSTEPGSAPALLTEAWNIKSLQLVLGKLSPVSGGVSPLIVMEIIRKLKCAYDALVYGTGKHNTVNWK